MIDKALNYTSDILNQYLNNLFGLHEKKVIVNNIIDIDGSIPLENANKVIITLIQCDSNPQLVNVEYDIQILITSNFDNYSESLKFLDAVIQFFKNEVVLPNPSFHIGITKMKFIAELMSYHDMFSFWGALGTKLHPSATYKMQLLTKDD